MMKIFECFYEFSATLDMSADWHIIGNSKSNYGRFNENVSSNKTLQKVQWFCDISKLFGKDEGPFHLVHTNSFHESERFHVVV